MKLINKPRDTVDIYGRRIRPYIKIWEPQRSTEEMVWEKLRTGKDPIRIDVGMQFASLVFEDEGMTIFNVKVFESFGDDTFRCEYDHYFQWR